MTDNVLSSVKTYFRNLLDDKKTIYKVLLIFIIVLLAFIIRARNSSIEEVSVDVSKADMSNIEMYIDIGGAVNNPGVYKVKEDTRLYEVVNMAGGLTDNADLNSINQAAFVEDGQKIMIPVTVTESTSAETLGSVENSTSAENSNNQSKRIININTASKDELKTLSGIGDVIAQRIIDHRSISRFQSPEDIMSVKGIGNAVYDKIKDSITV